MSKTVNVSDLSGVLLDWSVAKQNGLKIKLESLLKTHRIFVPSVFYEFNQKWVPYSPSTDWRVGGKIIEREGTCIKTTGYYIEKALVNSWLASIFFDSGKYYQEQGKTPLIAAMRCYVASKLGDTIEIPTELEHLMGGVSDD